MKFGHRKIGPQKRTIDIARYQRSWRYGGKIEVGLSGTLWCGRAALCFAIVLGLESGCSAPRSHQHLKAAGAGWLLVAPVLYLNYDQGATDGCIRGSSCFAFALC